MIKLIGFTGRMGSGKSTAIQCIKELQHSRVELVKFAAPLYDIQEYIYKRISLAYKRPENFIKDRKLLQFLGTEWGRGINENLWVNIWKEEVKYISENYPDVIIVCDDVRFDNEAELIKKLGGCLIKLESDKNSERIDITSGISGHQSESGIDLKYIDYVVENNGTIDDLKLSLLSLNEKESLW